MADWPGEGGAINGLASGLAAGAREREAIALKITNQITDKTIEAEKHGVTNLEL